MIYVREHPDPDFASLPHGRYDIVTKDTLQKFPEDILQTVLERSDFEFIEFVEGELTTVEVRRTDHPHQAIAGFLQEGIVQESSVYQHLLETTGKEHYERGYQQGVEQSARQVVLESLYSVLEYKFNSITVRMLRPLLEDVDDVQVLKQLHNAALRVEDLETFVQILETSKS